MEENKHVVKGVAAFLNSKIGREIGRIYNQVEQFEAREIVQHGMTRDASLSRPPEIEQQEERNEEVTAEVTSAPEPPNVPLVEFEKETIEVQPVHEETPPTPEPERAYEDLVRSNVRALSRNATTYELEKFQKNALLIFNHVELEGYKDKREGTNEDVKSLLETFSKFGFEPEEHTDKTRVEVLEKLRIFSEKDFTDYGCVVIAVMTHGTSNGLLRAKDERYYSETDILKYFKTESKPTLYGKPVVLLIQACRGSGSTVGVPVNKKVKIDKDHDSKMESYHLPVESDMLIVHSSFAGKPSFRPEDGSWFIQTLCACINNMSRTHDLESILLEVKRVVGVEKSFEEFNRKTGTYDVNKQMPSVISTLMRKLYLRSYCESKRSSGNNYFNSIPDSGTVDSDCLCYLSHFDYLRKCLENFIKENSRDVAARSILEYASENDGSMRDVKRMSCLISRYLETHCKSKYLHYYKDSYDNSEVDAIEPQKDSFIGNIITGFNWSELKMNDYVKTALTFVFYLIVYNMYNLVNSYFGNAVTEKPFEDRKSVPNQGRN